MTLWVYVNVNTATRSVCACVCVSAHTPESSLSTANLIYSHSLIVTLRAHSASDQIRLAQTVVTWACVAALVAIVTVMF